MIVLPGIARTAHAYVRAILAIVAAVVGVDANHGVHRIRRLDRLAQEQVRLHKWIRSDRNQPIRHIVFMNTITCN